MKTFLKVIAVLSVLLVLAGVFLAVFLDPNVFRERVEKLARQEGVALDIDGDLDWTIWPSIGITVNNIRLSTHTVPGFTVAKFKRADLLMAIGPLLKGNVEIDTIAIDGAEINLVTDEKGEANWRQLIDDSALERTDGEQLSKPDAADGQPMALAIDTIAINNSELSYLDLQSDRRIVLDNINATVSQFNLDAQPFTLALSANGEIDSFAKQESREEFSTQLRQQITLAKDYSELEIERGKFTVSVEPFFKEKTKDSSINGEYSLLVTDIANVAAISGSIDIVAFNLRDVLASIGVVLNVADDSAMTQFSLKTQFQGDKTEFGFKPLKVNLDKSQLDGSVTITDFSTPVVDVMLQGDQINIDQYLAPRALDDDSSTDVGGGSQSAQVEPPKVEGADDKEIIPLDAIKSIGGSFNIDVDKLVIRQIPLSSVALRAKANQGLITIFKAQADAYGGQIDATSKLYGRGENANVALIAKLSDIQIEALLRDLELDESVNLTGLVSGDMSFKTAGLTASALQENLTGKGSFTGAQMRFSPLNVEQKFCQLVNLANKAQSPQKTWQQFTEMKNLATSISIANNIISIDSLDASLEHLTVGSRGTVNLANNEYDVRMPLKLLRMPPAVSDNDESTTNVAEQFCEIKSNYWVNRSLSLLRCNGSLLALDPVKQCQFDSRELRELTLDYAEYKLRKKHGEKIDSAEEKIEKKKNELLEKLDEKFGGEGDADRAEQLLKELFKNRN